MGTRLARREFLGDVGRGMLIAGVGLSTALDMGLAPARAGEDAGGGGDDRLGFGAIEPLVALMQETPIDELMPTLVGKLGAGVELKRLVAAAALANARTFGGEDYVGFHTLMALAPAYHMARQMPEDRRALPVLKVLYRNTNRIQEHGGRASEVLRPVRPAGGDSAEALRDAVRRKDVDAAEATFAAIAAGSPDEAFNKLLLAVEDHTEVHRVVLPYRAWELLDVVGRDQAHTMLRQSVRYCVRNEPGGNQAGDSDQPRALLPRLFDQYRLPRTSAGTKRPGDEWVAAMCKTIFEADPATAADAAAAALAEGIDPADVGEAIALAANQLVLRDAGRPERWAAPGKPPGSVHGDSVGVHASDAVNAWRNMTLAADPRNAAACLILAAFEAARDRHAHASEFLQWTPRPFAEFLDAVKPTDPGALLAETENAIKANQQEIACALVQRYGDLGHAPEPVFALMLKYAVSEDGALHAEKYYNTTREEFARTRPAFRWRQLVALARVTASECGRPAPGVAQARGLLKI